MSQAIHLELQLPDDLARLRLPDGVQQRLTELLDKQDTGTTLTNAERLEAEGLVDLAELLSFSECARSERTLNTAPQSDHSRSPAAARRRARR
jgi:hypothetical protein